MTLQLPALDDRLLDAPLLHDRVTVRWMSPTAGLWVATRDGEHAGMVEAGDGSYSARNARGRALGSFADLEAALTAVDGRVR